MNTYNLNRTYLQGLANKAVVTKLERELTLFLQDIQNAALRAAKDGYYQIIQMIPEAIQGHKNNLNDKLNLAFPNSEIRINSTIVFISWN